MTPEDIRELQAMGFEIGNHTFTHPWDMRKLSETECLKEINDLDEYLNAGKLTSFAYPCGNYDDKVIAAVKKTGFTLARTVDRGVWDVKKCDPMKIPAIPLFGNSYSEFYKAVDMAKSDKPVVLCLHGIPDTVHNHCSNTPEYFEMMLNYLAAKNCKVMGLAEAYALLSK